MRVRPAFTLTEVLLAVVIVGIIAALVLPTLITHYQDKGFSQKYTRETQAIKNTIDGLATTENKGSFFETMMYVDAEPQSYADSSEKFLKKYMRVSKLCGDNNGDCFAKTYYEYKDGDKIVYKPTFKGSCAILKNGSSICITPQVVAGGVSGIIDLTGIKGPNVFGKDLQTFTFEPMTRIGISKATGGIKDTQFLVEIKEECEGKTCGCGDLPECDPCEGQTCGCGTLPECPPVCSTNPNNWDLTCCESNTSAITSHTHHCCTFGSIKSSISACQSNTTVTAECVYEPNHPNGDWLLGGGAVFCSINQTGEGAGDFRLDVVVRKYAQFCNSKPNGQNTCDIYGAFNDPENHEEVYEFENMFENSTSFEYFDYFAKCTVSDLRSKPNQVYNGTISEYGCTFKKTFSN
ncbi:MAG: type II secretion system protein [Candidatus Gastranaerophilaceae bacterium]